MRDTRTRFDWDRVAFAVWKHVVRAAVLLAILVGLPACLCGQRIETRNLGELDLGQQGAKLRADFTCKSPHSWLVLLCPEDEGKEPRDNREADLESEEQFWRKFSTSGLTLGVSVSDKATGETTERTLTPTVKVPGQALASRDMGSVQGFGPPAVALYSALVADAAWSGLTEQHEYEATLSVDTSGTGLGKATVLLTWIWPPGDKE